MSLVENLSKSSRMILSGIINATMRERLSKENNALYSFVRRVIYLIGAALKEDEVKIHQPEQKRRKCKKTEPVAGVMRKSSKDAYEKR